MVRKSIIFSFLFVSLLLLGSCRNLNIINNGSTPIETPEENIELVIWHTYNEEETQVFENVLIPLFEEEHPTISVKPVRQSHNDQLKSALISRASANKPPDVIRMDIAWIPTFAELNLIYPVSRFDDFTKIRQLFFDVPLLSNFYKGEYYGVPLNTNTKIAIYNQELLKRAGYDTPPKTMDDLIQMVEEHDYTIGMNGITGWESLAYFYALGGELLDEKNEKASGFLDSEQSIEAVQKLLNMYENGQLPRGLLTGNPSTWEGVVDGSYALIDEGHWFYSIRPTEVVEQLYKQTVFAPFPVTEGRGSVLGGENLVISKATNHLEASWSFVKWMTTETPQRLLLEKGLIPTNKNVEVTAYYEEYPYLQTYVESLEYAFLRPPLAQWSKVDEMYTQYMRLILSRSMTVEEGLREAAEKIDHILTGEEA
ncbi:extracellular solute-binding protein [Sutcliffiella sp. NC1]|uniref:extracellular solute-binding protein n=1 Tax=Sutcliffiella sp. NC1 TaxID=3004096 RepID=UPI0022DD1951|nr:extracellular solute-binding protein [Sutcliffiella sp. NC1]WBL14591.1 extracellular solute-binding protein [Sutcliffiella sp. NC1]